LAELIAGSKFESPHISTVMMYTKFPEGLDGDIRL